jgi:hypothetical protein
VSGRPGVGIELIGADAGILAGVDSGEECVRSLICGWCGAGKLSL